MIGGLGISEEGELINLQSFIIWDKFECFSTLFQDEGDISEKGGVS